MRCPNCNQSIGKNDRFCAHCGKPVNIPQPKNSSKNTLVIALITLSVCALSAAVISVAAVTFLKISSDNKNQSNAYTAEADTSAFAISTTDSVTDYYDATTETTTVPTTEEVTSTSESQTENKTVPTTEEVTSTSESQTENTTTASTEEHDPYRIFTNGYFIIKNTPNSAGLVLRSADSSSAEKLGIIDEGDVVLALSDYSSLDNGYVYIHSEDKGTNGWILANYLYPYNPYQTNISYKDFTDDIYARVCFDTPAHAGLNMRSKPTSSSDHLVLLFEGTIIEILEPYSEENNGYIYVGYDHPHAGEYYKGWVLARYLEYYGYRNW